MKLRIKDAYTSSHYQRHARYTVAGSVDYSLSNGYPDDEEIVELKSEVESQRSLISILVEILYDNKIIGKEDLMNKLLGNTFEEVEEN